MPLYCSRCGADRSSFTEHKGNWGNKKIKIQCECGQFVSWGASDEPKKDRKEYMRMYFREYRKKQKEKLEKEIKEET